MPSEAGSTSGVDESTESKAIVRAEVAAEAVSGDFEEEEEEEEVVVVVAVRLRFTKAVLGNLRQGSSFEVKKKRVVGMNERR